MTLTPNTQTIEILAKRILDADVDVRTSVLIKAQLIADAIDQLGEGYEKDLADRISMTFPSLSRWKAIGSNQIIQKNKSKVPSGMGSLYSITVLEGALDRNFGTGQGAIRIQKMIDKDQLVSSTQRPFIDAKIKLENDRTKKRKAKENEKKIEALVKGQVIANPSTLQDFIDKADLFRTIVVVPSSQQITAWKKMDFPVDIGDAYPIHEIRKTTQTAPVLCFMIVRRGQVDLGIDCLKGWGFRYRDVIAPEQSEEIILVGARGTFSDEVTHPKEMTVEEVLVIAEKSGKSPRMLIGAKTDRKGWSVCDG
jgi:hypothetical protein